MKAPNRPQRKDAQRAKPNAGGNPHYPALPRSKRLTDDEGLALFKHLAIERAPDPPAWKKGCGKSLKEWLKSLESKPRLSLAARMELNRLEKVGFQCLYIEQYQDSTKTNNRLLWDVEKADELLQMGDPEGRAANLAAFNALIQYANVAGSSIEHLRKTLVGGKSVLKAEFEGRLAGLIEVMSWRLNGGAKEAYGGREATKTDRTAKSVIELAEKYAKRAGFCWGVRRKDSREGAAKARGVYTKVKAFALSVPDNVPDNDPDKSPQPHGEWGAAVSKARLERYFRPEELDPLYFQRLHFLDVVRCAKWAEANETDLLKWSLERAKVYFALRNLPPRSD